MGVRTHKDRFEWVVIEGDRRTSAESVETGKAPIPKLPHRAAELVWVRQEVHALLDRHRPDRVAVDVCETSVPTAGRAEVDGIVTEALGARQVAVSRLFASTLRSRFRARKKVDYEDAILAVPLIANTPKTRRDPMVAAVSELPL